MQAPACVVDVCTASAVRTTGACVSVCVGGTGTERLMEVIAEEEEEGRVNLGRLYD